VGGSLFIAPFAAEAQPTPAVRRIGVVEAYDASTRRSSFQSV
jgi:hypothetical protein